MTNDSTIDHFEQIRKNWVIILTFIVGLIIGWTNIQNDIKNNAKDIAQQRVDIVSISLKTDATQSDIAGVKGDIKEINASLVFIKDAVTKK